MSAPSMFIAFLLETAIRNITSDPSVDSENAFKEESASEGMKCFCIDFDGMHQYMSSVREQATQMISVFSSGAANATESAITAMHKEFDVGFKMTGFYVLLATVTVMVVLWANMLVTSEAKRRRRIAKAEAKATLCKKICEGPSKFEFTTIIT